MLRMPFGWRVNSFIPWDKNSKPDEAGAVDERECARLQWLT
jgi:hypothetical protein